LFATIIWIRLNRRRYVEPTSFVQSSLRIVTRRPQDTTLFCSSAIRWRNDFFERRASTSV